MLHDRTGNVYSSRAPEFIPVLNRARVAQSLVSPVVFLYSVDTLVVLLSFYIVWTIGSPVVFLYSVDHW